MSRFDRIRSGAVLSDLDPCGDVPQMSPEPFEDWSTFRGNGAVVRRDDVLQVQEKTFAGGGEVVVVTMRSGAEVRFGNWGQKSAFRHWWNADRPAVGRGGLISGGALSGLWLLAGLASAFLPEPKPERLLGVTPRWRLLRQDLAQLEAAIAQYGSQAALARAVGVRPETVCNNLKRLRK